jgi:energy-coupling factor transport system ATP-binding protein
MEEFDIIIDNLTYWYPKTKKPALSGINLKLKKGETLLITGPAGAGKTTLCYCINGLIPHFFGGKMDGRVVVKGMDTKRSSLPTLTYVAGSLFQDPETQLVCPTVYDELCFGAENYGIPPEEIRCRVDQILEWTRLSPYKDRNPHFLSGGEQQACALGAVMTVRPEIYVLDEPTSNLDPYGSIHVLNLILELARSEKKTMVIVEHKLEELAPLVDYMIVMDEGKIVAEGKPREVFEKESEHMEDLGIKPPQSALIVSKLRRKGLKIDNVPLTLNEAIETFSKLLRKKKSQPDAPPPPSRKVYEGLRPIIEVRDLWFTYPVLGSGEGTYVLRGIDLVIYPGEFIALIGQNGSGKTTLAKHFNGLLYPTKGDVLVDGISTRKWKQHSLAQKVGYVFQNPDHQLCCKTVLEELKFGPRNVNIPEKEIEKRVNEVIERLDLVDIVKEDPFSLSKGERQRVAVGSILTMKPDVLVVDEPTTGQDFRGSKYLMEVMLSLNKEGKTIVVITHDMNIAAEYAERVIVLKDGKVLLDGPTRDVFTQTETLSKTFLRPPQVTLISERLGLPPALKVEEMLDMLNLQM